MAIIPTLSNIVRDIKGTSTVEYSIILGMIVLAIFVAIAGLAGETVKVWEDVSTKSANAISGQ